MWFRHSLLFIACCFPVMTYQLSYFYMSHNNLYFHLKNLTDWYPNISRIYEIGKSGQGRMLFVVHISLNPEDPATGNLTKPHIKFIANVHGHSAGGRQLLLNLIEYLLENYNLDETATHLIKNTHIHILTSLNPDGYFNKEVLVRNSALNTQLNFNHWNTGHKNINDVDLNTDFNWKIGKSIQDQPETNAVIDWLNMYPFVLSASFFSDELVVTYPYYSNGADEVLVTRQDAPTPDDKLFRDISTAYSSAHKNMTTQNPNNTCYSDNKGLFRGGIVNGAAWKPLANTMADFNYLYEGREHQGRGSTTLEVSVHLGCQRWVPDAELPALWTENKDALMAFMKKAQTGMRVLVMDNDSIPIENAVIRVSGIRLNSSTNVRGEYSRVLFPGRYNVTVRSDLHYTRSLPVTVENEKWSSVTVKLIRDPNSVTSAARHPTSLTMSAFLVTLVFIWCARAIQ